MSVKKELDALRRRYGGHQPGLLGAWQEYAVLCPLVEGADGLELLFEVRSSTVSQAGEVCFPGGRAEAGETPQQCALRETWEELAIPPREIRLLGTPDFICNQRGFLLRPVLGLVSPGGMWGLTPSPAEVAEVFTVPLDFFRKTPPQIRGYDLIPQVPEDFPYDAVGIRPDYPWARGRVEIPLWQYRGHAIWGMTARFVRDILSTPWD